MKDTLLPGIRYQHKFIVPESKIVAALYPESEEIVAMPKVFATGFLVGLLEWACIKAIKPHLDWPREQTVGTYIDVSHEAATPPGVEITSCVDLIIVEGKKLTFAVNAYDGVDLISKDDTSGLSSTKSCLIKRYEQRQAGLRIAGFRARIPFNSDSCVETLCGPS